MQNKETLEKHSGLIGLTYERLTEGLKEETKSDFDRIIKNKESQGGLTFEGTLRAIKFLRLEERVINMINAKIKISYVTISCLYTPIFLISSYMTFNSNIPSPVRLMGGLYLFLAGYLTAINYDNRKLYRKARQILTQPSNSSQSNK